MSEETWPMVTVGIVTRNRRERLREAVRSALAQEYPALEVLVADNASEDGTAEALRREFPEVRLIRLDENLGCPGGRNRIYERARGDYIVNLDDDGRLDGGAVRRLVETFRSDPAIGIVGVRQEDFTAPPPAFLPESWWETGLFRGGASAFRRKMLEEIGFYPEDFFFFKEEEFLSLKALDAGWRIVCHPGAVMRHSPPGARHLSGSGLDYYLFRNPLLVVVALYPGLDMWKYLFLRTVSYAVVSLRRGSFPAYLRAVGASAGRLARTFRRRRPVSRGALRRYFELRGRLPYPDAGTGSR